MNEIEITDSLSYSDAGNAGTTNSTEESFELYRTIQTPTTDQWSAYQRLYSYFNQELFGGDLPDIILNFRGRRDVAGFFAPERWISIAGAKTHEIALSPAHLTSNLEEVCGVLVHEMCHLWQTELGSPSRSGYHNKEWSDKMISLGLMPSTTGHPNGKRTGQHMSHYIMPIGVFEQTLAKMPELLRLPWLYETSTVQNNPSVTEEKDSKAKIKYTCPVCKTNVWGKSGLKLICASCNKDMASQLT
jgi:predicted SprT family Zn-dependent metalloprotease